PRSKHGGDGRVEMQGHDEADAQMMVQEVLEAGADQTDDRRPARVELRIDHDALASSRLDGGPVLRRIEERCPHAPDEKGDETAAEERIAVAQRGEHLEHVELGEAGTGGLAKVQHRVEELDLRSPVRVQIAAHGAALGQVRITAGVAHSRAAPGVPAPDEVVAEKAGHVAAQLVGVEWPMIGQEEVAVASVRTGGLTRKD